MSRDMRFPTMWYVRPAKPRISLCIRTVWSEPLLVAWVFYDGWTSFCVTKLNRRQHRLVWVYSCQIATLLKPHVAAQLCIHIHIIIHLFWPYILDPLVFLLSIFTSRARFCLTPGTSSAVNKRASTRKNLLSEVCEQHRRRPACSSAQSDQRLCFSHFRKYYM